MPGCVNDGRHLIDVLVHQTEKKCLVAIVQTRQVNEFVNVSRLRQEVLELVFDGDDGRREQAVKTELGPFTFAECRSFVEVGIQQYGLSFLAYCDILLSGRVVDFDAEFHSNVSNEWQAVPIQGSIPALKTFGP